jgi:Na+-translocating ferredoxin:NAD+ oxidoreductase RNF subunit RnfB
MARHLPDITAARCSGCGRCIAACHLRLFVFETRAWKKSAVFINGDLCTGCGQCAAKCTLGIIQMRKVPAPASRPQAGLPICCSCISPQTADAAA